MAGKNKIKKTDLDVLKKDLGIEQFNAFPRDISLEYDKTQQKLGMKLTEEAAGFLKKGKSYINMQEDSACFEAWCLIIKAQTKTTIPDLEIELDVEGINNSSYPSGRPSNGHLGRFLYRILKFSEQYKVWFKLSEKLKVLKDNFKQYLKSNSFETNAPSKEAETDLYKLLNKGLESYVEQLLVNSADKKENILKLSNKTANSPDKVGRQLPVGLFEDKKAKGNVVFTGGTSAADFWAVDNDDTIKIYELKSNNPMVGIITEIFFYSNYVYDVFIEDNKMKPHIPKKFYRNYDKIKGEKVQGIMLSNSDGWHPSLKDEKNRNPIIDIMNQNGPDGKIQYRCLEYKLSTSITVEP